MVSFKFALPLFALIVSSCSGEIESINYGKDDCHWCQMRIMDPKFGAEAVTEKGRVYKFDSGECLLHYLNEAEVSHSHLAVTNFESAESFMEAQKAYYLVSKQMPSPMGGYLNSFASKDRAMEYQEKMGGELFDWSQIKAEYSK